MRRIPYLFALAKAAVLGQIGQMWSELGRCGVPKVRSVGQGSGAALAGSGGIWQDVEMIRIWRITGSR
jgi:hypothetical protein